jgi:hypothetical protein|tara:strand:+ start:335 stop:1429 length:1095 start_codon:yes stop_codon:yes gene_type:complete
MTQLQTLKTNLNQTRIVSRNSDEINDDEILLKIERFSFTANNVTYGVAGDTIGYWQFFPASENLNGEWGCIPMWGFAKVVISNNKEIEEGERVFGYFPPAKELAINPIKISSQAFMDGKEHRKELPPVYNNYVRLNGEENYDASMDNIRALLFPLHITAFCLCDALEEKSYEGASQIIIVSASSKTAIGLAQGLADTKDAPKVVGLTSKNNAKFVESLGCYDEVISYDDLENVSNDLSVMVDMSGNQSILSTVQESLGDKMLKCITVGMTHWDKAGTAEEALVQAELQERTEFFFAPAHIQKRNNDWGKEGYNERTSIFMNARATQSLEWMQIKEVSGLDNFTQTYEEIVSGNINPNEGIIVLP